MFKLVTFIMSFILLTQLSFAETCPSVSDIKKNAIKGWKIYDSDDGTLLSAARETQFKKMVEQFALAEWKKSKNLQGSIHCYYRDKTGSSFEAYLAKDNFTPNLNTNNFWYTVSGSMHCAAGKDRCQFETRHFMLQHQLAKK